MSLYYVTHSFNKRKVFFSSLISQEPSILKYIDIREVVKSKKMVTSHLNSEDQVGNIH